MSVRSTLFGPVTKEEALAVARQECNRRGWPWMEPVTISRGLFSYRLMTNRNKRGGNVRMRISTRNGSILEAGFAPR